MNPFSPRWTAFALGVAALGACSGAEDSPGNANLGGAMTGGAGSGSAGSGTGGVGGASPITGGGTAGGGLGGTSQTGGSGGAGGGGGTAPFVLTSPAFDHVPTCSPQNTGSCELFPTPNIMMTIGGQNQSPELNWGSGPAGTMGYALCLHDLSFNNPHWCIWGIPAATSQLPAGLARTAVLTTPNGAHQKSFSNNDSGYMGPGAKGNVYQFRVYALNTAAFMPNNPNSHASVHNELEDDQDDIVLGTSTLTGRAAP